MSPAAARRQSYSARIRREGSRRILRNCGAVTGQHLIYARRPRLFDIRYQPALCALVRAVVGAEFRKRSQSLNGFAEVHRSAATWAIRPSSAVAIHAELLKAERQDGIDPDQWSNVRRGGYRQAAGAYCAGLETHHHLSIGTARESFYTIADNGRELLTCSLNSAYSAMSR